MPQARAMQAEKRKADSGHRASARGKRPKVRCRDSAVPRRLHAPGPGSLLIKQPQQWSTAQKTDAQSIQPGDAGIWATCAMKKEAKAVIELHRLFDEVRPSRAGYRAPANVARLTRPAVCCEAVRRRRRLSQEPGPRGAQRRRKRRRRGRCRRH